MREKDKLRYDEGGGKEKRKLRYDENKEAAKKKRNTPAEIEKKRRYDHERRENKREAVPHTRRTRWRGNLYGKYMKPRSQ